MSFVCPSWLSFILYNPIRKVLTDREKIMDESFIAPDSVVLEVGAGNGFLTEVLAERAKKVFAVELQDGMVKKLRRRIGNAGANVEIIQGDAASVEWGKEFADVCLLYYSFHEIWRKSEAAENIAGAVRPGGVLAVYEPTLEVNREDMSAALGLFEHFGFEVEMERDQFFTRFARLRKLTVL